MILDQSTLAGLLFFIVAALYSSIGHAGASGYLAIMALLSFAPDIIRPTSLILNIVVSFIASVKFIKAGYFDRKIFAAFILTSFPFAFLGGQTELNPKYFKLLAGSFLIISSILLLLKHCISPKDSSIKKMPLSLGLGIGSVIGFISGLIGVGGGIFLSPILIMANWTEIKNASGIAALFIFLNSLAAFVGNLSSLDNIHSSTVFWIGTVAIGGFIGSHLGVKKFNKKIITMCLFVVLMSAGLKFILVDFFK